MSFKSVGQVADELGIAPNEISSLFYLRVLNADQCPVVSGRRLIPSEYIVSIKAELSRRGKLPVATAKAS